jgi:hypothetical protein
VTEIPVLLKFSELITTAALTDISAPTTAVTFGVRDPALFVPDTDCMTELSA